MANRVTAEITAKGFAVTAEIDGETVTERWERTSHGSRQTTESQSFERSEAVDEELHYALSDVVSACGDVMNELG